MTSCCLNCEHFDGGGLARVERAGETGERLHGDCLSTSSDRFETVSDGLCPAFFPDSTRFPAELTEAAA